MMENQYQAYQPPPGAGAGLIKCIWRVREYAPLKEKETILPKGNVEIIFNYSTRVRYLNPSFNQDLELPTVFINGINTKPLHLIKHGGHEFIGIQLSSIGLRSLLNVPVRDFNDCVVSATEVYPELLELAEKLYVASSFSDQVAFILDWFQRRLSCGVENYALSRAQCLMKLARNPQLANTVSAQCARVGLSRRQLSRFSHEWFGMSTESFFGYQKYLEALDRLHQSGKSLTEIGLESGYYDQSHFIRQFKFYTGLTPKQYRNASKQRQAGHIFP